MIPKFRVYDKWDKVMKYVESIEWNRETKFDELELIGTVDSTDENFTEFKHPDWFILMQSIGLYDKNDVEIFEGDILKIKDSRLAVYVVERHKDKFMWVLRYQKDKNQCFPFYNVTGAFFEEIEVIGNIYENPDLLRRKQMDKLPTGRYTQEQAEAIFTLAEDFQVPLNQFNDFLQKVHPTPFYVRVPFTNNLFYSNPYDPGTLGEMDKDPEDITLDVLPVSNEQLSGEDLPIGYFCGSDIDVLEEAHPGIEIYAYTLEELQLQVDMEDVENQMKEYNESFDKVVKKLKNY